MQKINSMAWQRSVKEGLFHIHGCMQRTPFLCVTNRLDSEIKKFNWRAYSFICALIFTLYGVKWSKLSGSPNCFVADSLSHQLTGCPVNLKAAAIGAFLTKWQLLFELKGCKRGKLHVSEVCSSSCMCDKLSGVGVFLRGRDLNNIMSEFWVCTS